MGTNSYLFRNNPLIFIFSLNILETLDALMHFTWMDLLPEPIYQRKIGSKQMVILALLSEYWIMRNDHLSVQIIS